MMFSYWTGKKWELCRACLRGDHFGRHDCLGEETDADENDEEEEMDDDNNNNYGDRYYECCISRGGGNWDRQLFPPFVILYIIKRE